MKAKSLLRATENIPIAPSAALRSSRNSAANATLLAKEREAAVAAATAPRARGAGGKGGACHC